MSYSCKFKYSTNRIKVVLFATLISVQLIILKRHERLTASINTAKDNETERNTSLPIILHWTPYFHDNHLTEFFRDFPTCKYRCIYTEDRTLVKSAKAIVFHSRHTKLKDLPPEDSSQLRVFFTLESPEQTWFGNRRGNAENRLRSDYFNLTINYRTFSDILLLYGYFRPLDGNETKEEVWSDDEIDRRIANKTRLAFAAVSHCFTLSKREDYLKALKNHINITQLGKCTNNKECITEFQLDINKTAIWNNDGEECLQRMAEDHYFYFAFENSVCPEYVTEKLFRLYNLVVPVVLSRAIMPHHIPSDSYIAASDFKSVEEMAKFLQSTANNATEYKKFFKWTKKYRKLKFKFWNTDHSCQLCEILHKRNSSIKSDYRPFMDTSVCRRGFAQKLSKNDHRWIEREEQQFRNIMKKDSVDRPWFFT